MIKLVKKLFKSKTIAFEGDPYLTRYYIFSNRFFGLYLHEFHRADSDRDLHNHPWAFAVSFILRGHYIEQRLTRLLKPVKQTRINFIPGYCYHRIAEITPGLTTLFFRGPRNKRWGFLRAQGNEVIFEEHRR